MLHQSAHAPDIERARRKDVFVCWSDGLASLFARIARLFSDEMMAISSAGPAMFGSVQTVQNMSAKHPRVASGGQPTWIDAMAERQVKTVRSRDNNDLLDLWCINPWLTSHMIGAAHSQRLDAAEQERVHAMFAAARSEGSCTATAEIVQEELKKEAGRQRTGYG